MIEGGRSGLVRSELGRLEDARAWLRKAMELGDEMEIKMRALDDPDLEPLWANIGKLGRDAEKQ